MHYIVKGFILKAVCLPSSWLRSHWWGLEFSKLLCFSGCWAEELRAAGNGGTLDHRRRRQRQPQRRWWWQRRLPEDVPDQIRCHCLWLTVSAGCSSGWFGRYLLLSFEISPWMPFRMLGRPTLFHREWFLVQRIVQLAMFWCLLLTNLFYGGNPCKNVLLHVWDWNSCYKLFIQILISRTSWKSSNFFWSPFYHSGEAFFTRKKTCSRIFLCHILLFNLMLAWMILFFLDRRTSVANPLCVF